MAESADPRKPFYLAFMVANSDGTIDPANECADPHGTEEEAIQAAQEQVDEHGGEYFVYRVIPLCRVHRVSVQVERLDAGKFMRGGEPR